MISYARGRAATNAPITTGDLNQPASNNRPLDDAHPATRAPSHASDDQTGLGEHQEPQGQPYIAEPRRALVLFAGRPRPGDLPSALRHAGWRVDAVDRLLGGADHDMADTSRQEAVLQAVERQHYHLVWLGTPCASFSVLWTQADRPALRSRQYPSGLPDLSESWRRYVEQHNSLANFSAAVAFLTSEAGATFVIENPVDRGMRGSPHFRWAWRDHAPLWLLPSMRALAGVVRPRWVTFAQCAWGSDYQKWTTLMVGGSKARHLDVLNDVPCSHSRHRRVAQGYDGDGMNNAVPAGEYPTLLCAAAVAALSARVPVPRERRLDWLHQAQFSAEARELASVTTQPQNAGDQTSAATLDAVESATAARQPGAADGQLSRAVVPTWRSAPEAMPPSWPESVDVTGEGARTARNAALRYVSRRRAEPELSSILEGEALPVPHPPPSIPAAPTRDPVPWPSGAPPRPVRIEQLYRPGVYAAIRQFIATVASDLRAAEQAAQQGDPTPTLPFRGAIEFPAATSQPQWARECVWLTTDPADCVPLQPYTEEDRPEQDVSWQFFEHWGRVLQWPDADMLHRVTVTGCDSQSTCPRDTVIFGHHGGLRAEYVPARTVVDADTAAGWVSLGTADLHTVPQRLVPRNVVAQQKWKLRQGELVEVTKWRVTTDDSMATPGSVSRNAGIDPSTRSYIELPTLKQLGRAVAILRTTPAPVASQFGQDPLHNIIVWALDLSSAYRRLAAARHERWLQGFIWHDGVRTDARCEFGSAHLVDFFERVSSFVLAVAERRIRQYDEGHPYDAARVAWSASRTQHGRPAAPTYSSIYLDDGFGVTCLAADAPARGKRAGELPVDVSISWHAQRGQVVLSIYVCMSRAQIHLAIARQTFVEAGWEVAEDKVQLGPRAELLGLALDTRQGGSFFIPDAKKQGILREIAAQRPPSLVGQFADRTAVERLVGRLGHVAQVVAEGNAHMQPLFRLQNATFQVRIRGQKRSSAGGSVTSAPPSYRRIRPRRIRVHGTTHALTQFQDALSWWAHVLGGHVAVPLAPRLTFPDVNEAGCLFVFTDAAREDGTGHGGFTCIRWAHESFTRFYYVSRRWSPATLRQLQTNALSMPAGEAFGAVVLLDAILIALPSVSHAICFTDSDATARGLTTAASGAPQLNHLFEWLVTRWPQVQFLGVYQQGKRNGVSDALSRRAEGAAAIVREAAAVGLVVVELAVCQEYSDLLAEAANCPLRHPGGSA